MGYTTKGAKIIRKPKPNAFQQFIADQGGAPGGQLKVKVSSPQDFQSQGFKIVSQNPDGSIIAIDPSGKRVRLTPPR